MPLNPFGPDALIWPASAVFAFTLFTALWVTGSPLRAMLAALLKAGFFFAYFWAIFDGTWSVIDDRKYLDGGARLLDAEVGIANFTENWPLITEIGVGHHVLYYLYNAYAFRIFGEGYYAPVACNILLTALIACFGARLAVREFGLTRQQERVFFYFLLFHPDILTWSSILNIKDILILFLHVLLLFSISFFYQIRLRGAFLLAFSAVFSLFYLRYYIPLLFITTFAAELITSGEARIGNRILLLSLLGIVSGVFLFSIGASQIVYSILQFQEQFTNPLYGSVRFILSPRPFYTEAAYAFLGISALLHWMLMPFAALGVWYVYRIRTPFSRFFLIYFTIHCVFYGSLEFLQGPRHRVQLDYAWAIFQFLGLALVFGKAKIPFRKTVARCKEP